MHADMHHPAHSCTLMHLWCMQASACPPPTHPLTWMQTHRYSMHACKQAHAPSLKNPHPHRRLHPHPHARTLRSSPKICMASSRVGEMMSAPRPSYRLHCWRYSCSMTCRDGEGRGRKGGWKGFGFGGTRCYTHGINISMCKTMCRQGERKKVTANAPTQFHAKHALPSPTHERALKQRSRHPTHRYEKGQRFARASLGCSEHIAAAESVRQRCTLDSSHRHIFGLLQRVFCVLRDGEFLELARSCKASLLCAILAASSCRHVAASGWALLGDDPFQPRNFFPFDI
jgi:hypothetical protein